MNKDEALALYGRGKSAWNTWAEEMLAKRAELVNSGAWALRRQRDGAMLCEPGNTATIQWFNDASADFSGYTFADFADFRGFLFPGNALFEGAEFLKPAEFSTATFRGIGWFESTVFCESARFERAAFNESARFDKASLCSTAWFEDASFGWSAWFPQSVFKGYANFRRANFQGAASFNATMFERALTLEGAQFAQVPDFIQAHFVEAPLLDTIVASERRGVRNPGTSLAGRYRALRRLAIQGHDHEAEQLYFAEEIRSRRFSVDTVWSWRFWLGIFYQLFSNFGRSPVLPLLWWFASTSLFAIIYLGKHLALKSPGTSAVNWVWAFIAHRLKQLTFWVDPLAGGGTNAPPALECVAGTGDAWIAAISLSMRRGFVFTGLDSVDKLNQIYACLYGLNNVLETIARVPDRSAPFIPDDVAFIGLAQVVISAVFIFLLLLAVRNQFRIK